MIYGLLMCLGIFQLMISPCCYLCVACHISHTDCKSCKAKWGLHATEPIEFLRAVFGNSAKGWNSTNDQIIKAFLHGFWSKTKFSCACPSRHCVCQIGAYCRPQKGLIFF